MDVLEAVLGLAGKENSWNKPIDFQRAMAAELRTQSAEVEGPSEWDEKRVSFLVASDPAGHRVGISTHFQQRRQRATAVDQISYRFWRDVEELEGLTGEGALDEGHIILISDDSKYWVPAKERPAIFDEFRLTDGRLVGPERLKWRPEAADGSRPDSREFISVGGEYRLQWQPFGEGNFRYLLLRAGGSLPLPLPDIERKAEEGDLRARWHLERERDRSIIDDKKRQVLRDTGRLACEVCGFHFADLYGMRGSGFCEVHHRVPLAMAEGPVETKLSDLAIVCANCHRMLHRSPWLTVEELGGALLGTESTAVMAGAL